MRRQADFIKKVQKKTKQVTLDLDKIEKQSTSSRNSLQRCYQLKKQDIIDFRIIGIFDKKVIVAFNSRLQLFGYFDFHAIHERIRYEYYTWKIKNIEYNSKKDCIFDQEKIEKTNMTTRQIYGKPIRILLKMESEQLNIFKAQIKKAQRWGIEFQKGGENQVFVTSFKPILGKQLNQKQIGSIFDDLSKIKGQGVPKVIDEWIAQFSCKGAFKFNDELTSGQGKDLIYNLSKCEFPWNCVHGRNTIHVKSWSEIDL